MWATLRPPPPSTTSSSLYHSPLLFTLSAGVEQQQQATCSVEILCTDAADFFRHPSLFLSFFWPTSFSRKKAESKQKIDEIRKCCCLLALLLLLHSFLLFSSSSSICCCRCWFCSIAKHILVTDLFFCSFFSPPACCCCFFCVLFVFHFLKFRLLLFFLLPLPPFHYTVTVFRVNLQVTLSDLGIILLYKVYRQSQPEALLSVPVCACLCVSAVRWLKSANAFRQQCEKVTKEFQLQEKKKKQLRRKRKRRRGKRKSEVSR